MNPRAEIIAAAIRDKAENLYLTRQYLCAEAVLLSVNKGLDGPLAPGQAVGLSAGLADGMGGSGCLCGAVGGAALAIGLFLGSGEPHGRRREIRATVGEFHDWFKTAHGAVCCRVLVKGVKNDPKAHFRQCASLTAAAAEKAALLILEKRPELLQTPGTREPLGRDSRLLGRLKWAFNFLFR